MRVPFRGYRWERWERWKGEHGWEVPQGMWRARGRKVEGGRVKRDEHGRKG